MRDVAVIGGGPAGLSAALNGAAEGLDVLLLERSNSLGGQAGTSSRIENYLGFPGGVAGEPLIKRATAQARRLGAVLLTDHAVENVEFNAATGLWVITCAGDSPARHVARTVILATGVDYRRLPIPGGSDSCVLYGAPASEHEECRDHDVVVVGGGNSAGQAALNLARLGAQVALLVRRPLGATMSQYLIERIAVDHNIVPILGEAREIRGGIVVTKSGTHLPAHRVFAYIGMTPRTDFIKDLCSVKNGFVRTEDFAANGDGLFAAGDVRADSYKRVSAAVGEGAIAAAAAWRRIYNV